MTNDDCQSSFGCHVAVSDVAPAARPVSQRVGLGQTGDGGLTLVSENTQ
jgi:hypothetical protein